MLRKILFPLFFAFIPAVTIACNCFMSDENGYFIDNTYNRDELVYITGDGLKINGNGIIPVGDIYIIPNDGRNASEEFELRDVFSGFPNVIQGGMGAGAFIGELIAIGPLPPGQYDIIMDNNRNGMFDPNSDDCFFDPGNVYTFKVIDSGPIPAWRLLELGNLKANAAEEAISAAELEAGVTIGAGVITAVNQLLTVWKAGGDLWPDDWISIGAGFASKNPWGPIVTSYNGGVLYVLNSVMKEYARNNSLHYLAIALDPPDQDFKKIVPLPGMPLIQSPIDNSMAQSQAKFANALLIENMILDGIFHSVEKFQGAQVGNNDIYLRTQAKAVIKYAQLWNKAYAIEMAMLDSMKAYILANNLDTEISSLQTQTLKDDLNSHSFSSDEISDFAAFGISQAKLDSIKNYILNSDTAKVFDGMFSAFTDDLQTKRALTKTVLDAIVIDAQLAIDSVNLVSIDMEPEIYVSGDSSVVTGNSALLDGNNNNANFTVSSWLWDFDNDGDFDDASGQQVNFTPTQTGIYIIGLKVTNGFNTTDYAYYIVEAKTGNYAPVITTASPAGGMVEINTNMAINLSVTAIDPDSDPLTYQWFKNDTLVGSGASYNYTPSFYGCSKGVDKIYVIVEDNNQYSNPSLENWVVFYKNILDVSLGNDTNAPGPFILKLDNGPLTTYQWSTGSSADSILVSQSGTYDVTATRNGCSESDTINVTLNSVSIIENESSMGLSIHPNPYKNYTTITYVLKSEQEVKLEVMDLNGKTLLLTNESKSAGKHQYIFNAESLQLSKGMYFIRLTTQTSTTLGKLIEIQE